MTRSPTPTLATNAGALLPHASGGSASQQRKQSSSWLSGGRLLKRGHAEKPMGEMNTTPLIDVMLVLLVMFIITVPIQTHSVKVDLPTTTDPLFDPDPVKNKLTIDANNVVAWNGTPVDQRKLADLLAATKAFPVPSELQFQPDERARYVVVDETLATVKHAKVSKLGFVGNEQYTKVF